MSDPKPEIYPRTRAMFAFLLAFWVGSFVSITVLIAQFHVEPRAAILPGVAIAATAAALVASWRPTREFFSSALAPFVRWRR